MYRPQRYIHQINNRVNQRTHKGQGIWSLDLTRVLHRITYLMCWIYTSWQVITLIINRQIKAYASTRWGRGCVSGRHNQGWICRYLFRGWLLTWFSLFSRCLAFISYSAWSFQSTKSPECNTRQQFALLFYVCLRSLFNDKELLGLIAAKY